MINRLTCIIALVIFWSSFSAYAESNSTESNHVNQNLNSDKEFGRWVTVTGVGNLSSGKDVAKRSALLAAYRRAVNEGGSVEITEFSQLRNFKDVVDIVTKKSRGVIRSYTVENEGVSKKDSNYYQVTIKALVVDKTQISADKSEELQQLVAMIGSPKVMIIVGEQDAEQTQWGKAPAQNSVEEAIAARFKQVGYEVITSADIMGRAGVELEDIKLARQGISTYADKLGKLVNADLIITGLAEYQLSESSGGTDISAKIGAATLSAKALIPGVGRVLHISKSSKRFMSVQGQVANDARVRSITKAAEDVADELRWEVPKILSKETRDIQIIVKKIDYTKADELAVYIKSLEGVDDVELVNWTKDNGAELRVKNAFTGPREHDYARLISKKFNKIKVDSLSSYSIVFTL